MKKKTAYQRETSKFVRIYQYADGEYLVDSSQPDPEKEYGITSISYTPHSSTRYTNVHMGSNGKAQRKDKNGILIDVDKDLPEVYADRDNCCGCTACYAVCPFQAIVMRPDEEGFLYPVVDAEKCIRCYKCLSVCAFKEAQREKGYLK